MAGPVLSAAAAEWKGKSRVVRFARAHGALGHERLAGLTHGGAETGKAVLFPQHASDCATTSLPRGRTGQARLTSEDTVATASGEDAQYREGSAWCPLSRTLRHQQ